MAKSNKKPIYPAPTKDGKPYWIPIVVKNKDFLIGYLDGINTLLETTKLEEGTKVELMLDSTRFNDVLDEKGTRVSKISKEEVKKILREEEEESENIGTTDHPDNKEGILQPSYLEMQCSCGYYYNFKSAKNIPEESLFLS